jgi:hypothetical protein
MLTFCPTNVTSLISLKVAKDPFFAIFPSTQENLSNPLLLLVYIKVQLVKSTFDKLYDP